MKPGVLQSTGSQRVRHNLVIEQLEGRGRVSGNLIIFIYFLFSFLFFFNFLFSNFLNKHGLILQLEKNFYVVFSSKVLKGKFL